MSAASLAAPPTAPAASSNKVARRPASPAALTPLLRVSLSHAYYGASPFTFTAQALPATAAWCSRLGLRLRQAPGALELCVLASATASGAPTVADWAKQLRDVSLCWRISPASPDFAAFTGIDFVAAAQRVVLTPQTSSDPSRLTQAAQASTHDLLPWRPLTGVIALDPALRAGSSVELQSGSGEKLGQLVIQDPRSLSLDLRATGSGVYQLVQHGRVLDRWFADERTAPSVSQDLAPLLVLPGDWLAQAFADSDRATNAPAAPSAPVELRAAFPARAVFWRYHVFNVASADSSLRIEPLSASSATAGANASAHATAPNSAPASTPRRRAGSGPSAARASAATSAKHAATTAAAFRRVSLPDLPDAVSFESVAPIPLAERPAQRFALRDSSGTRLAPLPLAGLDFQRPVNAPGLCSEIFVHL